MSDTDGYGGSGTDDTSTGDDGSGSYDASSYDTPDPTSYDDTPYDDTPYDAGDPAAAPEDSAVGSATNVGPNPGDYVPDVRVYVSPEGEFVHLAPDDPIPGATGDPVTLPADLDPTAVATDSGLAADSGYAAPAEDATPSPFDLGAGPATSTEPPPGAGLEVDDGGSGVLDTTAPSIDLDPIDVAASRPDLGDMSLPDSEPAVATAATQVTATDAAPGASDDPFLGTIPTEAPTVASFAGLLGVHLDSTEGYGAVDLRNFDGPIVEKLFADAAPLMDQYNGIDKPGMPLDDLLKFLGDHDVSASSAHYHELSSGLDGASATDGAGQADAPQSQPSPAATSTREAAPDDASIAIGDPMPGLTTAPLNDVTPDGVTPDEPPASPTPLDDALSTVGLSAVAAPTTAVGLPDALAMSDRAVVVAAVDGVPTALDVVAHDAGTFTLRAGDGTQFAVPQHEVDAAWSAAGRPVLTAAPPPAPEPPAVAPLGPPATGGHETAPGVPAPPSPAAVPGPGSGGAAAAAVAAGLSAGISGTAVVIPAIALVLRRRARR